MKYWYYIYLGSNFYDEGWSYIPIDLSDDESKIVSLNTTRGSKWSTPISHVYLYKQPFMEKSNGSSREELRNELIDKLL